MPYDAEAKQAKLKLDDDDFLSIVRAEREAALGMDKGDALTSDRELALEYYKGEMLDMPAPANRSKAMQTVVSDMIGQAMPDLVEIFLGGEDVGAFRPVGEEDEEAAKQETEVVNNVIANENDGFGIIHDYVHDALLMKAGVFHAYLERYEAVEEETVKGQTALAVQELQKQEKAGELEVLEVKAAGQDPMAGPLYDVTVVRTQANVKVCIETVAPEDFATARDTVDQRSATYSVMRQRPRAQKLKAMGFDAELVDDLPSWSSSSSEQLDLARDTAGESDEPRGQSDALHDMRQVLVYVHALRVDADGDGKPEIWRVITDEKETVVLDKEELEAWPFAVGTPYRQPHRAYGRSLADLSIELQRIMTSLLRLHLDGGYFSINARHEIDENKANEHTLSDYLNNSPGFPVRVAAGGALTPLISSRSDFNALDSLEYMATVGETRTGITRNAQGLNPDTLHDTAKGAQALMTNAQKRLRLIARTLAETGIKDLFLLVHSLLRTSGAERPMAMRLRNKWVQVDPTSWGERKDFSVEIGMGAGGREMMLQAGVALSGLLDKIVQAQGAGAISPPIATAKNLFSYADWFREQLGVKRTTFFTDPESPEGQQLAQAAAQQAQAPDPKVMEAQAKSALAKQAQDHAEAMARGEADRKDKVAAYELKRKQDADALADRLARDRAAAEASLAEKKAEKEYELAVRKQDDEYELAVREQDREYELKQRAIEKDRELGHAKNDASAEIAHAKIESEANLPNNRRGGRLDE